MGEPIPRVAVDGLAEKTFGAADIVGRDEGRAPKRFLLVKEAGRRLLQHHTGHGRP